MPRQGRALEELVARLEGMLGGPSVDVKSPDSIVGEQSKSRREIDCSIRARIGSTEILIIVECRDREGIEDVTWIEQLASKQSDVRASRAIAVSTSGFSSGARHMASAKVIELRTIDEITVEDVLSWFGCPFMYVIKNEHRLEGLQIRINAALGTQLAPEIGARLDGRPLHTSELLFRRKRDGAAVSLADAWQTTPFDEKYAGISHFGPPERRKVRIPFSNPDDRFEIQTTDGYADIAWIEFDAVLWYVHELVPVSNVNAYGSGQATFAQSVKFEFESLGKPQTIEFHKSLVGEQSMVVHVDGPTSPGSHSEVFMVFARPTAKSGEAGPVPDSGDPPPPPSTGKPPGPTSIG